MAGGYKAPKDGLEGVRALLADLQRQIDALRGGAGIRSAVIYDPATGARIKLGDGQIAMWSDYTDNPDNFGRIYCDPASGINYFRIYPPFTEGLAGDNALTIQGSRPGADGNIWLYSAGVITLQTRDSDGVRQGELYMNSAVVTIDTPQLSLFSLPAIGAPDYTLGYDFDGTNWSVCLITSAAKYKQDIAPAAVDPEAVLAIEPVTFRSKTSVEKNPDAKTEFGVIADQLHDLGLGDLLVTYKDGEPDAVKYDRLGLALLPVVKSQQAQIDALTKRLDALEGATS